MSEEWDIDPYSPWVRILVSIFIAGIMFLWLIEEMYFDYLINIGYGLFAFVGSYLLWGWLADKDQQRVKKLMEEYERRFRS